MSSQKNTLMAAVFLAGAVAIQSAPVVAQAAQNPQSSPAQSNQQPTLKPSGSSLAIPAAPANPEETTALQTFQSMPNTDLPKKIAAGEDFLKKYPDSQYRPMVYSALVLGYLQTGNAQKAFEVGDKEVALKPDDVETLAVLGQTIPRAINSSTPDPDKQLQKAEDYAKRAIEVTPTIAKPEGMTDQHFMEAKNSTLAMAHGGLGLVYFRRGKFNEAIPELEQSVKIDPNPNPDPVNLYVLGGSNQKASHYDEAAAVFARCATIAGGLQTACKTAADESKKQASTQMSTPK